MERMDLYLVATVLVLYGLGFWFVSLADPERDDQGGR